MTDKYDVVVLGNALAGSMAAIAAAETGLSVGLISDSEPPLRNSTGTIDVLGYTRGSAGPIAYPFEHLDGLPETHPYQIVGEESIREGLALFDSVLDDSYRGSHTDANGLVPTLLGAPKPAARYPESFEAGLLPRPEETLIVGLDDMAGFDGEFIATNLDEHISAAFWGANVSLAPDIALDRPRLRIATALDRNERWPAETPIRDRLVELIDGHLTDESRVGLPAILGRQNVPQVIAHLESELGVDVFEIPTDPPSLPGIRLADRLERAVEARGVTTMTEVEIADFRTDGPMITELLPEGGHPTIEAEEFVLATGGLIAGGLIENEGRIVEPKFDLPVEAPKEQDDWRVDSPFDSQPFARFGIAVDEELRPLDGSETPFNNMRACGRLLGGHDPTEEHSGSGVAIATGVMAGRLAAAAVMVR